MIITADTAIILVAAGRGSRMGHELPKQWHELGGLPVLARTILAFQAVWQSEQALRLVVVIHPDDREKALSVAGRAATLVEGGASRTASVRAALEALALEESPPRRVLIHDAARPLVSPEVIDGVCTALETHVAAAPALPVTDALWVGSEGQVNGTQDRTGLWRAQTPQGFDFATILAAHRAHPGEAADDVEIARLAGHVVAITPGDDNNIKLTYPQDFARAEQVLALRDWQGAPKDQTLKGQTMDIRCGTGYDVHAFEPGDHVWLCGVRVPHDKALKGHSDADVGMHALTDAIYGALAEGDIGRHFPPSDPQWKGAASHIFLRHAIELARSRGFELSNADVTLICERPKIGAHAQRMREALAGILEVEVGRVSVKATTSEQLGFTGREEGIAALASATMVSA